MEPRGLYSPSAARRCMTTYVQRNQPPGVPPLELTGERTLPDVPEENYWYRRHLAVYRWIAERCAGQRVVDMACGEGYGVGRARRARGARWSGSTPTPRRTSTRGCGTRARACASSARCRGVRRGRALRRDRLPADDRARRAAEPLLERFASLLAPGGVAYVSTPNRLTLAPPGARALRQPVARARVHAGRVPRAARAALLARSSCSASSMRASCALHELALRLGWDRVHPRAAADRALLRPVRAGDRRARLRAAAPATLDRALDFARGLPADDRRRPAIAASSRSCCTATCPTSRGSAPGRSARSGCWRRSRPAYLPLIDLLRARAASATASARRDGRRHARAGRPARAAGGGRALPALHARACARDCHRLDIEGLERDGQADAGRGAARARRATTSGRPSDFERRDGDLLGALRRAAATPGRSSSGPPPRPMPCCRCSRPSRACGCSSRPASRRTALASAAGAAGSGCPSARTGPGSRSSSRRPACARSASTRPPPATRSTSSSRWRPPAGPVAVPIDWQTIALVWDERGLSRRPRLPRLPRADAQRHAPVGERRRRRTTARPPLARAREHARDFVARVVARAATPTAPPAGGPRLVVCALDTELLGHWWYEGPLWLEAVVEEARAARPRARDAAGARSSATSRCERAAGRVELGHGQGPAHLGLAARRGARLAARARRSCALVGALGRSAPNGSGPDALAARAARELLALQSSDWAFMATRGARGRLSRRAGPQTTRPRSSEALGRAGAAP